MNKYQLKIKTQLGIAYYYCYGDDRFEKWLEIKNIKFKKLTEKMSSGKNLFNEKDKEIERLNNIINEKNLLLIEFQEMEQRLKEIRENYLKIAISSTDCNYKEIIKIGELSYLGELKGE